MSEATYAPTAPAGPSPSDSPTPTPEELTAPLSVPAAPVAPEEVKAQAGDLSDKVLDIPMGRWLRIVRRFDMTQDEILGDFTALLIVAANERVRDETGKDGWDRVEAMSLRAIQEFLGISADEAPAAELEGAEDAGPKSVGDERAGETATAAPSDDVPRARDLPE